MNPTQRMMLAVVNRRHALNLTMAALAELAGVSVQTIYLFERHARTAEHGCRMETLLALADAVGLVISITDPAEENTAASERAA